MIEQNTHETIKISENGEYAVCRLKTSIYPLEVIHSAAYMMLDKAYVLLDGDPKKEILVEIRPKKKEKIHDVVMEFNEELINYAVYKQQTEKNKALREAILQRVLLTNAPITAYKEQEEIPDPEGIMKPHEENEKED